MRVGVLLAVVVALAAGVVLGLSATSVPANSVGSVAPSSPVPAPPTTTSRAGACVDAGALVPAYSAGQAGDARSTVEPGSIRCAGPYATAKIDDPSLPDTLNVLFSVAPLRRLRSGTGPVCEVGSSEGGLPPVTASQGDVLGCA
ncbi:hypothetical protein [Actinomycetospora soli]|uniref:hypothetical protein n=1 Tax=Actinomycetospora soli TaxID=2893887 RepID=UPI001E2F8356|nr:hypothetical protein [Actinomycetospora soli]MCD2187860.1 hypothetical protein [Actinomycetospora soli]